MRYAASLADFQLSNESSNSCNISHIQKIFRTFNTKNNPQRRPQTLVLFRLHACIKVRLIVTKIVKDREFFKLLLLIGEEVVFIVVEI